MYRLIVHIQLGILALLALLVWLFSTLFVHSPTFRKRLEDAITRYIINLLYPTKEKN